MEVDVLTLDGISVTGTKMGSEKETMGFRSFHMKWLNSYLAWMPVGMQTNHGGCSVHAQLFFCQNGGADICDIIK